MKKSKTKNKPCYVTHQVLDLQTTQFDVQGVIVTSRNIWNANTISKLANKAAIELTSYEIAVLRSLLQQIQK